MPLTVFPGFRRYLPIYVLLLILLTACSSTRLEGQKGQKSVPNPDNLLRFEQSPYLLQHKDNPVNWKPWGPKAFAEAKARDLPIFLSIGYSTCHWCHVMEHESFEDSTVAALMNEHFICIKVDREERPDVDEHYMSICQMMTGQGGWPLTVVMDHRGEAFFSGTYFPRQGRFNRPGMVDLLPGLAQAWNDDRPRITQTMDQVSDAVTRSLQALAPRDPAEGLAAEASASLLERADKDWGGFGDAPKFPTPQNCALLLRRYARDPQPQLLQSVEKTLQEMRRGGIYDQVGHGFHRYSTDANWLVPHFEKMLYDQALLVPVYVETWQLTRRPFYEQVVRETCDYVLERMTSPGGGFYSAEDADSEGEEGKFYIWTLAELEQVLGSEDARYFADVYGASPAGNWAGESGNEKGINVLRLPGGPDQPISEQVFRADTDLARLEALRLKVFAARDKRVHPFLDDKVLCDWNGMMIAALAKAAFAFDEPRYLAAAQRASAFLLKELRDERGELLHRWRDGQAGIAAMHGDYAALIGGLLALYQADFDPHWLQQALALQQRGDELFWDRQHHGYFMTSAEQQDLPVRRKEFYDGALPAGNSLALENLVVLSRLSADSHIEGQAAELAARIHADGQLARGSANRALAAIEHLLGGGSEVVLCVEQAEEAAALLAELRGHFDPFQVRLLKSAETASSLSKLAPFTKEMNTLQGQATAYHCRDFVCEAPVNTSAELVKILKP